MADVLSPGILESQVIHAAADDVPRDFATNVVHHHINSGLPYADTDYANHAAEIMGAFNGTDAAHPGFDLYNGLVLTVKVFDLGDAGSLAAPRVPRAMLTWHHPGSPADNRDTLAPGQLTTVLSFYAGHNIVGKRGRIYVGPLPSSAYTAQVPGSMLDKLLILGHCLFDIGGENVSHVILHKKATAAGATAGSHDVVTNYWAGNEWGVIRRRQVRATTRETLAP